jgi:hypothetical protein
LGLAARRPPTIFVLNEFERPTRPTPPRAWKVKTTAVYIRVALACYSVQTWDSAKSLKKRSGGLFRVKKREKQKVSNKGTALKKKVLGQFSFIK